MCLKTATVYLCIIINKSLKKKNEEGAVGPGEMAQQLRGPFRGPEFNSQQQGDSQPSVMGSDTSSGVSEHSYNVLILKIIL